MKDKKLDGVEVWKEFEDVSALLGLSVIDRAVYSWLLRHTRLEGKLRERFTVTEVADKVGISKKPVLQAIRRLADHGALRFIERSYSGHRLEVRLPGEIPSARRARDKAKTSGADASIRANPSGLRASPSKLPSEPNIEEMDFFVSPALRKSVHAREGGKCFYCRRRTSTRSRCLDHVVPRAKSGEKFVPQRRFVLRGMQLAEEGSPRGRFFARVIPRGGIVPQGPRRPPSGPPRPRRRQAPAALFDRRGLRNRASQIVVAGL